MILDPHIHSTYSSDSTAKPRDIIKRAKAIGLDAIAIADHNTIKGSLVTIEEAKDFDDFIVMPAMEDNLKQGSYSCIGNKRRSKTGFNSRRNS